MLVPNAHERLITELTQIPIGCTFSAQEVAKWTNSMPKSIGRKIRATGMAEYIPDRCGGTWKRI